MAKKASSGKNAMDHARAILEQRYGKTHLPPIEASKRIIWLPGNNCGACGRGLTPRSQGEDVFGCFDLVALGVGCSDLLLQVTTDQGRVSEGSTVWKRRQKIEAWFETVKGIKAGGSGIGSFWGRPDIDTPTIEIWSWVRRQHMRRFRFAREGVDSWGWAELLPMDSPKLKRKVEPKVKSAGEDLPPTLF